MAGKQLWCSQHVPMQKSYAFGVGLEAVCETDAEIGFGYYKGRGSTCQVLT